MPEQQYKSLTQVILDLIRERIYNGDYTPGSRLNITDLAQQYEASPVPVREALRNLEAEGLVKFLPNRGVVVQQLSAFDVRELFLMRIPLEVLAATEAARRGTPDEFDIIEEHLRAMDAREGEPDWHLMHEDFHRQFYALSRFPRLSAYVNVLRGQMRPYAKHYLSDVRHLRNAQKEHYAMLKAARRRDTEALRQLIREHLRRPAHMALSAFGTTDFSEFDDLVES